MPALREGDERMKITSGAQRTIKHGDLTIVASRLQGTVTVGSTPYSTSDVRKLAAELPPDLAHKGMAEKLIEQAEWAEGRDL
jgi:hypothetical protein